MVIRIGTWNLENLLARLGAATQSTLDAPPAVVDGYIRAGGLSDRSAILDHRLVRGHLKVVWARLFGQCGY